MNIIFEVLNKYYGYTSFKEGQYEIIINILKGRDSFAYCLLVEENQFVIRYLQ